MGLPPNLAAYSTQWQAWQGYPRWVNKALEVHSPKAVRGNAALCRTYSSNP